MRVHELKTDPDVFCESFRGDKPLEIRRNDRDFHLGDLLVLKETQYSSEEMNNGKPLVYTGRVLSRIVTCIISGYGLKDGYVALGLRNI